MDLMKQQTSEEMDLMKQQTSEEMGRGKINKKINKK